MKVSKESEKMKWDQMRSPTSATTNGQSRGLPKLMLWLIFFVSVTYVFYTLKLVANPHSCPDIGSDETDENNPFSATLRYRMTPEEESTSSLNNQVLEESQQETPTLQDPKNVVALLNKSDDAAGHATTAVLSSSEQEPSTPKSIPTNISHLVFGIAASAKLWPQRKNYINIWYRPETMRGVVWLDSSVPKEKEQKLPEIRISDDTTRFVYRNRQGHRSAIRISRIISETLRLGKKDVRWFVLGDDDTVFITDNLVRVLSKYDHNQYYYIGSSSESHLQNIYFSYAMAYGGGGFALSYPLAVALEKMQDRCIQRYPGLYGSDDRMQACMAELGVPLTKEVGFHQYDVYGNLFGLLAAHPVTPLVSLHHLDVVEPIFPDVTRVEALHRLAIPMKLDSAGLMQQSICYDPSRQWTVSVSWGFVVQIIRGILSPREMEMPTRTFLNWYKRADYTAYAFNTRPLARNPCQKPFVFYLSKAARVGLTTNKTVTEYVRHRAPHPLCRWKMADPSSMQWITVNKKSDPQLWERSPRRNCCRVVRSKKTDSMVIDVGLCNAGEVTEVKI